MSDYTSDRNQDSDRAYRDAETLRQLYYGEGMSLTDVAEEFDISASTVRRWMQKHDLERRNYGPGSPYHVGTVTKKNGYVMAHNEYDGVQKTVYIHQLVAIANGADPERVFSDGDYNVHHRNGIRWDNRPENVELITSRKHGYINSVGDGIEVDHQTNLSEYGSD